MITISGSNAITVSPKVIDGDIRAWQRMVSEAMMYHSKMRVVSMPDGGVRVEFYSPWDLGEPVPEPVVAKAVEKPWWRFW